MSSILLAFPYNLRLSLPLLFLPQFSNKQQSSSTIFQQIKEEAEANANAYVEARSRFAAFLPQSSILFFTFFFFFGGRSNVGDYFEQCFVIF